MKQPAIIMVAPNGARKTHKDHPALPVSIPETVAEALSCYRAGATILHAHVRGKNEEHVLDTALYKELLSELKLQVPDMLIQITTEAVGIFTPQQQVACVQQVLPEMASVALKEMTSDFTRLEFARDFYHWALETGVHIQHIVYNVEELQKFIELREKGIVPLEQLCVLFVLGRYAVDFQSTPEDLQPFLQQPLDSMDWFTCAFGRREQDCLLSSINAGGHARVGFENNFYLANGEIASSTSELVAELKMAVQQSGNSIATAEQVRDILHIPVGTLN